MTTKRASRTATKRKRLTVNLEYEAAEAVAELAAARGISQSAVVGEWLTTAAPVMRRVAGTLQHANSVLDQAPAELVRDLDQAQDFFENLMGQLLDTAETEDLPELAPDAEGKGARRARSASGASAAQDPQPLTGGSQFYNTLKNNKPASNLHATKFTRKTGRN